MKVSICYFAKSPSDLAGFDNFDGIILHSFIDSSIKKTILRTIQRNRLYCLSKLEYYLPLHEKFTLLSCYKFFKINDPVQEFHTFFPGGKKMSEIPIAGSYEKEITYIKTFSSDIYDVFLSDLFPKNNTICKYIVLIFICECQRCPIAMIFAPIFMILVGK